MGTIAKTKTVFSTQLESAGYAVNKCRADAIKWRGLHFLHTLAVHSLPPGAFLDRR